jgi:hypothetical protein
MHGQLVKRSNITTSLLEEGLNFAMAPHHVPIEVMKEKIFTENILILCIISSTNHPSLSRFFHSNNKVN